MQGNPERPPDAYRWWVLVTVVFGAFAGLLDSTIVNTALPRIQRDFGANLHLASYVVTGYVLAAGVVVPAAGFLANRFGMKRVYLGSPIL
jgi:MFS transporter, DHA2 family, multidrug resistance protein